MVEPDKKRVELKGNKWEVKKKSWECDQEKPSNGGHQQWINENISR